MSVLKARRTVSKAEYINKAIEIYHRTLNLLSRLSSRYARLLAPPVMTLATEVVSYCEKANSIYPNNEDRTRLRNEHLLNARASLAALDVQLANVFSICMLNPQGCFTTGNNKTMASDKALEKLSNFAQDCGELIDEEKNILTSLIK